MKIKILGSGREVGKSSILVDDGTRVLLDCGIKIQPEPPKYPIKEKRIDGVIISHAHLDHSGGAPVYSDMKSNTPFFMTDVTLELVRLLIKDSMKISRLNKFPMPFNAKDFKKMIKNTKLISYNEKFNVGNFKCELYDSGHIPGSSGIFMENKNKKIFYTGDIQVEDTHLLNGCTLPKETDILITESTYSSRDRMLRIDEESRLIELLEEALARNEKALIPVFAVGRAQEVMLILEKYTKMIALDGMAKTASDIISSNGRYLKSGNKLKKILDKVTWVHNREEREWAAEKFPIILTTAGMLGGGPAIHYLRAMKKRAESKVLFTGFLVEDSPGRTLLETKIFKNAEEKFKVQCDLQQMELSAHADRSDLFDIMKRTNPEKVICVHGDRTEQFAKDIKEKLGIDAYAPKNGEVVKV